MANNLFKSSRLWFFVVALILIFFFCLEKCNVNIPFGILKEGVNLDQSYSIVPKNATFISAFNLSSILKEIDFKTLKSSKTYIDKLENFYNQNQPFTLVFSDPIVAGINTSKKAVFFIDVGDKATEVYSASILSLHDEVAFSQMIAKTKSKDFVKTEHYKYSIVDAQSSVAWSKNYAIFISTDPSFEKGKVLEQCFNPRRKKYHNYSPEFSELMSKSRADVSFWIDLGSYSRNQLHATDVRGEISKDLLIDNYLYGDLEFQNGAVDLDIQFKLNNKIGALLKNVFADNSEQDVVKYIPQKTPSFLANISLNINGLLNFLLRDADTRVEARKSLIEYGLVLEDFTEAFTGDVLFASYPAESTKKNSVLFGAKINDQEHFDNLIKVWEDIKKIENEGDGIYKVNTGTVAFFPFESNYPDQLQRLIIKDKYVFVSLDKNMIDAVLANPALDIPSNKDIFPTQKNGAYLSAFGNKEFKSIEKLADQFSIKQYKLSYNGEQLIIHLSLNDEQKPALKQLLSLQ